MLKLVTIYFAGFFTIFSPCILPILPILFKGALASSKRKFLVLLMGLAITYAVFGWSLAYFGSIFSLNESNLRIIIGITLSIIGIWLISKKIASSFSSIVSGVTCKLNNISQNVDTKGYIGPFFLGSLFGIVWTPCTGPVLAFAITLASSQSEPIYSFLLMLLFGIGSATPIFLIGTGMSKFLTPKRSEFLHRRFNVIFGLILLFVGVAILTNFDRFLQSLLITISPDWLINLATYF